MYKRAPNKNAFHYKEPKAKMPRLDVSLTSAGTSNKANHPSALHISRPSTPKAVRNDNPIGASSSTSNNKPNVAPQPLLTQKTINVPPPPPPLKDENLWDDADDECILIASQMVDNMDMDAINQQIIVQSMNMSQSNAAETKVKNVAQNILMDLLRSSEEEDRIFSEIENFDDIGNPEMNKTQASQRPTSPSVFKVPMQIRHEKRTVVQSSTQFDMNISFRPQGLPQSTQFSQNIEIPRPMEPAGNFEIKF